MVKSGGLPSLDGRMAARDVLSGSASYILSRKLKAVKSLILAWNRGCFGRLDVNKKLALSQVEDWDCVEEVREMTLQEIEAKKEAKDSFKKWVTLEEIHWR